MECNGYQHSRCECLPAQELQEPHNLWLYTPLLHTLTKLKLNFSQPPILMQEAPGGVLIITLTADNQKQVSALLIKTLTRLEMQDTYGLLLPTRVQPNSQSFAGILPLNKIIGRLNASELINVIKENRLHTYFQPIVDPVANTIFGYECLLRGIDEDGALILPKILFDMAATADMLFYLDREARITALRSACQHSIDTHIFINFNPTSIYDPAYCLQTTYDALQSYQINKNKIIFEVVESQHIGDIAHTLSILNSYRENGLKVALDDLGAGFSSLNLLRQLQPDFVKLDIDLIKDIHQDHYKQVIVEKILEMAQRLNITTIAEGVECEAEKEWLMKANVSLLQGFLFGIPSPEIV
jgi:EAL domain-containing protein (putative c-di-GMP-specific phosphodiesterase class I)